MSGPAEPLPHDRPIGELVHELVEEGKAYARAEAGLARTIAMAKAKALAVPSALFGAALFIAMAALNALAFGLVLALAGIIGPLAAGITGMLILAAIACALAWWGVSRLKRTL